jgi:hypothetical protein
MSLSDEREKMLKWATLDIEGVPNPHKLVVVRWRVRIDRNLDNIADLLDEIDTRLDKIANRGDDT